MPEFSTLLPFIFAVVAIQLSPGPDMMMVIARGIGQGRRTALICVAGISAASVVQIPALAFGVAAIFQQSELAYSILKNLGAVYLVYLGVRFILRPGTSDNPSDSSVTSVRAAFWQGFWSNLVNPKSLVFLLAFLPQFVDPTSGSIAGQLVILGIVHKSIGLVVDSSVAILAGSSGEWLKKHTGFAIWQSRFVGVILVGLGLRLAFDAAD